MAPAYNEAIAPFLAGTIGFLKRPRVRVLVVGGGTGVFSRDLLPAVRRCLQRWGQNVQFSVVETDIESVVREAPASSHRVQANFHQLPFRDGSFDLIVGQSMIHQGEMQKSIPEIGRVMATGGCFFHTQDSTPVGSAHVGEWMRRTQNSPVKRLGDQENAREWMEHNARIHSETSQAAVELAKRHGLSSIAFIAKGDAVVSKNHRIGQMQGINLDTANHVFYYHGGISGRTDPSVPADKKKLDYAGTVIILAKTSTTALAHHLKQLPD